MVHMPGIRPHPGCARFLAYGKSLSGSRGYGTLSPALSILASALIGLSRPIPQPECGGMPQSNTRR